MKATIRKVIVGDSYSYCIKYIKGTEYKVGSRRCTITDILPLGEGEVLTPLEIYVTDGNSTFLWKTIYKGVLEVENDVNFS